jgi:hypothetical protein
MVAVTFLKAINTFLVHSSTMEAFSQLFAIMFLWSLFLAIVSGQMTFLDQKMYQGIRSEYCTRLIDGENVVGCASKEY